MTVLEVLDHVKHVRLREAYEKSWLLRIAVQPNCNEREQKAGFAAAEKIGRTGSKAKRRSAYDVVDRESRIRMIGSSWQAGGHQWAACHPRQVKWLESQGLTLDQAKEEFERWWAERTEEPPEAAGTDQPGGGGSPAPQTAASDEIIDFKID